MIGKTRYYDFDVQQQKIGELLYNLTRESDELLVARMKNIVPEFTSNNSRFEKLDHKGGEKVTVLNFNTSRFNIGF